MIFGIKTKKDRKIELLESKINELTAMLILKEDRSFNKKPKKYKCCKIFRRCDVGPNFPYMTEERIKKILAEEMSNVLPEIMTFHFEEDIYTDSIKAYGILEYLKEDNDESR